jgi:MFS family permease
MSDVARRRWVPVSASAMGTVIEWYDFFLYSSAAVLVFNTQFFGDVSPVAGTMIAFATYAVGFVVRPLGGIVFGNIGDRVGRKPVLLATVLLMGVSTIAIGLLPNFDAIGYWAPALLVLLRVVQGFGAGAEAGPWWWPASPGARAGASSPASRARPSTSRCCSPPASSRSSR